MEYKPKDDPRSESSLDSRGYSPEAPPLSPPRGDALEPESIDISYSELQSRFFAMEGYLADLRAQNLMLSDALEEASQERDSLRIKLLEAEDSLREREGTDQSTGKELIESEETAPASLSEPLEERSRRIRVCAEVLGLIRLTKECFWRIADRINEDKSDIFVEREASVQDDLEALLSEAGHAHKLGLEVESKFIRHEEMKTKEKKDLENSVRTLSEENSDVSGLLRAALLEKEAAEKSLNKVRGGGKQRRMAIFHIAEWGLQKAGFGFMMGGTTGESPNDNQSSCNASITSEGSQCEEDGVSPGSTVEKIIKNLRHEVTELRCSLEEYRLENDYLQGLTRKQSLEMADSALYIKVLEEKENMLTQNVEDLNLELKGVEEEAIRWRKACELEVEAGKTAVKQCEREVRTKERNKRHGKDKSQTKA